MPNIFIEAVVKHLSKTATPADLSAEQWADIPRAIRERSFFSARVTNTRHLQKIKDSVESILAPRIEQNEDGTRATRGMDPATARLEIKQLLESLAYDPGAKRGTIQDLSSDQRIDLQIKQNTEAAQGFGQFVQGTAPGAIDAFPAQELIRVEDRMEPRDWEARWREAGGQFFGGRMIALKSSPIWETISRFGVPYPPFDFNSGMWVQDVPRSEAEELGLISPAEQAVAPRSDFHLPENIGEPDLE